jgi:hypothetical protein
MRWNSYWRRRLLRASGVALSASAFTLAGANGVSAQLGGVGGAIGNAAGNAGRAVDQGVGQAGRAVDENLDRAARAVDRTQDRLDRTTDRSLDAADRNADRAGRAVDRNLDRAGRAIDRNADRLDRAVDRTAERFDDGRGPVRDAIRGTVRGTVEGTRRIAGRGRLGVTFDDGYVDGVLIGRVDTGSPAYRAGLRRGDEIISINGRRFDGYRGAVEYINGIDAGENLDIVVWRDGRRMNLTAALAADVYPDVAYDADRASLGVFFDTTAERQLRITRVERGSPAFRAGLRPGDYILSMDGRRVRSYRDVTGYLGRLEADDRVDITVWRDGRQFDIDTQLAARSEVFGEEIYDGRRRDDRWDDRRDDRWDDRRDDYRDGRTARRDAGRTYNGYRDREDYDDYGDRLRERFDERLEDRDQRTRDALERRSDRIEDRARQPRDEFRDDVRDRVDDVRDDAADLRDDARDRASDARREARDEFRDPTGSNAERTRDRLDDARRSLGNDESEEPYADESND